MSYVNGRQLTRSAPVPTPLPLVMMYYYASFDFNCITNNAQVLYDLSTLSWVKFQNECSTVSHTDFQSVSEFIFFIMILLPVKVSSYVTYVCPRVDGLRIYAF